jgi:hypothetical protein
MRNRKDPSKPVGLAGCPRKRKRADCVIWANTVAIKQTEKKGNDDYAGKSDQLLIFYLIRYSFWKNIVIVYYFETGNFLMKLAHKLCIHVRCEGGAFTISSLFHLLLLNKKNCIYHLEQKGKTWNLSFTGERESYHKKGEYRPSPLTPQNI